MSLASLVFGNTRQCISSTFIRCSKSTWSPKPVVISKKPNFGTSRRVGIITLLVATEVISSDKSASGFDFRITVPDQTVEEAESTLRYHARKVLDVKSLIEAESWREAQRELRKNSAYLKQDIYTIIQGKPGTLRPLLRKLYFDLFNNVTKLDFAARDEDAVQVRDCYNNVAASLEAILSKL